MKLYSKTDVITPFFSLEKFVLHYQSANVISQEALSDYLFKIKDIFVNTSKLLTSDLNDKITFDTISTKFETLHKIKKLNFNNVKDTITSKPENFKGKYLDYSLDLINSSKIISENTEKTLSSLKIAISSFINEYTENKVSTLYGATYFKESNRLITENKKDVSKYFPYSNSSSKAYIKDILKTLNDVESLYKNIETLDATLNLTKITYIAKLTNECSDLIDILIEQNIKTNILNKNIAIKKELVNAIYSTAKEVEFLNYLYANAVIFYGSFKNLVEDLNKLSDKN